MKLDKINIRLQNIINMKLDKRNLILAALAVVLIGGLIFIYAGDIDTEPINGEAPENGETEPSENGLPDNDYEDVNVTENYDLPDDIEAAVIYTGDAWAYDSDHLNPRWEVESLGDFDVLDIWVQHRVSGDEEWTDTYMMEVDEENEDYFGYYEERSDADKVVQFDTEKEGTIEYRIYAEGEIDGESYSMISENAVTFEIS